MWICNIASSSFAKAPMIWQIWSSPDPPNRCRPSASASPQCPRSNPRALECLSWISWWLCCRAAYHCCCLWGESNYYLEHLYSRVPAFVLVVATIGNKIIKLISKSLLKECSSGRGPTLGRWPGFESSQKQFYKTNIFTVNCGKDENKENRPGIAHFKKKSLLCCDNLTNRPR